MAPRSKAPPLPPLLVVEDLARSGLLYDPTCMQAFNPHPAPPLLRAALPRPTYEDVAAVLLFQFNDLDAAGNTVPLPYATYTRARMHYLPPVGFAAHQKADTRPKYLQRTGTGVMPYLPPGMDYVRFLNDKSIPLVTVEGEKKALALAGHGVYAVGITGVNAIANKGQVLHPLLERLAAGRKNYNLPDTDAGHTALKPSVSAAMVQLSARQLAVGSDMSYIAILPRPDAVAVGTKWAADDWLLTLPPDTTPATILAHIHTNADPDPTATILNEMNDRYTYLTEAHGVADNTTRFILPSNAFLTAENNRIVLIGEPDIGKNGIPTIRMVKKMAGTAWQQWPRRSNARHQVYRPGEPGYLLLDGTFNVWKGWACKPAAFSTLAQAQAAAGVFWRALCWLHGPADAAYMLHWHLYPLAHPQANKQSTVPILQSEAEGVGKSVVFEMLIAYCYGHNNALFLKADAFKSGRNDFADKMILVLDDAYAFAGVQEHLNFLATAPTMYSDPKYIRPFTGPNLLNLAATTNSPTLIRYTEDGRRYFPPYINQETNDPLWKEFCHWFEDEQGGAIVLGLANAMRDHGMFDGWDRRARAPRNAKREEMEDVSQTTAARWLAEHLLARAQRDIVCYHEAYSDFVGLMRADQAVDPRHYAEAPFQRALNVLARRQSFIKRPLVMTRNSVQNKVTAYAMRNMAKWDREDDNAWRTEIRRVEIALRETTSAPRRGGKQSNY